MLKILTYERKMKVGNGDWDSCNEEVANAQMLKNTHLGGPQGLDWPI